MDVELWKCRNCGREVAMKLPRCPRCQFDRSGQSPAPVGAAATVQRDSFPSRGAYRVSSHTPSRSDDVSPWGYVAIGLAIAFVGGLVTGLTDGEGGLLFGLLLVGFGSLLSSIGTIALGVRIGMADWQRSITAVIDIARAE